MTHNSGRPLVLLLLVASFGLLIPGLLTPVLSIRGVLTREGIVEVAPTMLEKGIDEETIGVLKAMMNPLVVKILEATGDGGLRTAILSRITPQVTTALQKGVEDVEVYTQTRSIAGSIRQLYRAGSPVPATLILIFSVVVPFGKSFAVGWAMFVSAPARRQRILKFVEAIAKWSMADVFVVALIITYLVAEASESAGETPLVAFKATFGAGFYWFTSYCVFSLASQQFTARMARMGASAGSSQ
jgi:hypothetical protein